MAGIGTALAGLSLAARFPRVASTFGAIPKPVWEAVAVIGYLFALIMLHQHYAHAAIKAAVNTAVEARDQQWSQRLAQEHAAALTWKGQTESQSKTIATLQRKTNDEENSRTAADAAAARVRGPGAAAAPAGCRPANGARPSAAADRPGQAAAAGSNAAAAVPAANGPGQFAIVPWDWLVTVILEHDQLRTDVATVLSADAQQRAAWDKARGAAPTSSAPGKVQP